MYPFLEFGNFKLPMYGLSIAIGVVLAFALAVHDCKRKKLCWEYMLAMGAIGLFVGLIGAKLLYLFVSYSPSQIISLIKTGRIMALMSGGFVFYGGLITGVPAVILMAKIIGCKLSDYENVMIKVVPLAHAFGRIGCFFAGCCYGKPTDSFLGIAFENPLGRAPSGVPLFPVQLLEAGMNLLLVGFLWYMDKKYPQKRILLPLYLIIYAIERFILEYFRYDAHRGIFLGVSTSQWISMGIFAVGVLLLIYRNKKTAKC